MTTTTRHAALTGAFLGAFLGLAEGAYARDAKLCDECSARCKEQFAHRHKHQPVDAAARCFVECAGAAQNDCTKPGESPTVIARKRACVPDCMDRTNAALKACRDPDCEQHAREQQNACYSDCNIANETDHRQKILAVKHHGQKVSVWCWAASVGMVVEYLQKKPVDDCAVAAKLDRAMGGGGECCEQGVPVDRRCFRGRRYVEMTDVMGAYSLRQTEIDRPLTWKELVHSIDKNSPVIAGLYLGGSMGHAVVIVGYREPSTIFVDDPWQASLPRPIAQSYTAMTSSPGRGWVGSWYFLQDEVAGMLHPTKLSKVTELVRPTGPARSKTSVRFPLLKDGPTKDAVEETIEKNLPIIGACYDKAFDQLPLPPASATAKVSFAVQGGAPTFIMTKDAGGLPSAVTSCVNDVLMHLTTLFPPSKDYAESQRMEVAFEKIPDAEPVASSPTPADSSGAAIGGAPKH